MRIELSSRMVAGACAILAVVAYAPCAITQRPASRLARLQLVLTAEDQRATGPGGDSALRKGVRDPDPLIRLTAVRALGRLQRPELDSLIAAALHDRDAGVRVEAANALAQSLNRVRRRADDPLQYQLRTVAATLRDALASEQSPTVIDALTESLGRLPLADSASERLSELAIAGSLQRSVTFWRTHGLYWIAVARQSTGPLTHASVDLLARVLLNGDTLARRAAALTLTANRSLDTELVATAMSDRDDQVRRLGVLGSATLEVNLRSRYAVPAMRDSSPLVRHAAVTVLANLASEACASLLAAFRDDNDGVALAAIDALPVSCAGRLSDSMLLDVVIHPPASRVPDHQWQRPAHATAKLAQLDSAIARPLVYRLMRAPRAESRIYAAIGAGALKDSSMLLSLSRDPDNNVRETAITRLWPVMGSRADSVYIAALGSSGNQVVLAAATALGRSRNPRALPAIWHALDSITRLHRDNSHDVRAVLLTRIGELGSRADSSRLTPYLSDFDTTTAHKAEQILRQWGIEARATPNARVSAVPQLATLVLQPMPLLRVTMSEASGGGSFTVRLFSHEAPATTARLLRLVSQHWYDGHVFQRVEPGFVIQGGGPDASEYVGDADFMRDELALRSHLRGTIGISTRGRDTGDAQWFINLTDNLRLDHEYTVAGEIVSGRDVAEQILQGDRIARIDVVASRARSRR